MSCNNAKLLMIFLLVTALLPIQALPKGTRSSNKRQRQLDHCGRGKGSGKNSESDPARPTAQSPSESDPARPPTRSPTPENRPPVPTPVRVPTSPPTYPSAPDSSLIPGGFVDNSLEPLSPACQAIQDGTVYTTSVSTTLAYSLEIITKPETDTQLASESVDSKLQTYLQDYLIECNNERRQLHSESNHVHIQGIDTSGVPSKITETECNKSAQIFLPESVCYVVEDSVKVYIDEESTLDSDKDAARRQVVDGLVELDDDDLVDNKVGILGGRFLHSHPPLAENESAKATTSSTPTSNVERSISSGISPVGTSFLVIACVSVVIVAAVFGRRQITNRKVLKHVEFHDEFSLDDGSPTPGQKVEKDVFNFGDIKMNKAHSNMVMMDNDGNEVITVIQGKVEGGDTWSQSDTSSDNESNISALDDNFLDNIAQEHATMQYSNMAATNKRPYYIEDTVEM